jgi:zeaxanthin epoxidase
MQVQSNALAALEAIDPSVAADVMAAGCITGDRINGLCDGLTGEWYCKFDTYHPAVDNGLPVTRVISRVTLQHILVKHAMQIAGKNIIQQETKIVAFEEDKVDSHDRVCSSASHFRMFVVLYMRHTVCMGFRAKCAPPLG